MNALIRKRTYIYIESIDGWHTLTIHPLRSHFVRFHSTAIQSVQLIVNISNFIWKSKCDLFITFYPVIDVQQSFLQHIIIHRAKNVTIKLLAMHAYVAKVVCVYIYFYRIQKCRCASMRSVENWVCKWTNGRLREWGIRECINEQPNELLRFKKPKIYFSLRENGHLPTFTYIHVKWIFRRNPALKYIFALVLIFHLRYFQLLLSLKPFSSTYPFCALSIFSLQNFTIFPRLCFHITLSHPKHIKHHTHIHHFFIQRYCDCIKWSWP